MLTKDTAICIRAVDYSETSQILTFFARKTGKIAAIAKGSKRPKSKFDGPLEVFSYGQIVFSDSHKEKLSTLTEFQQQGVFTSLAGNLFTLHCCLFAAELLNNLTNEYDPHPLLFDSFIQFLQDACDHQASSCERRNILILLILFQLSLLRQIGLQPVLNSCSNCKTKYRPDWPRAYFSHSANGLICRDCQASFPDSIRLTADTARCLNNFKLLAEADEKTLNEIEKLLIWHFTDILNRTPKMAKYILET